MSKRGNFYRRDPMAALNGMTGLTLEERGVYNTVLDLLYSTWRPVEDNRQFIANWCGCAVQKLNPIIDRLIAKEKLRRVQEGGAWVLTNDHFDDERRAVKGVGSGRKTTEPKDEVEEKSAGVEEKSPGVSENPRVLEADVEEKQRVIPLEKRREEERRVSEDKSSDADGVGSVDPDRATWDLALQVLTDQGNMPDRSARTFFAGLLKEHGLTAKELLPAVGGALSMQTREPRAYLVKAAAGVAKRRTESRNPARQAFV